MTGAEVGAAPEKEAGQPSAGGRAEAERREEWERCLAPLRHPPSGFYGLSGEDGQTLRDIRFRVERLLEYGDVLPAGLTAMLRDYVLELGDTVSGRWQGIGASSQYEWLADRIGEGLADGEWLPGSRIYMDDYSRHYYLLFASGETLGRAVQTLAARGEVSIREDGYYAKDTR